MHFICIHIFSLIQTNFAINSYGMKLHNKLSNCVAHNTPSKYTKLTKKIYVNKNYAQCGPMDC